MQCDSRTATNCKYYLLRFFRSSSNVTRINHMQPFHLHNIPAPVAIALRCITLASLSPASLPVRDTMAVALAVTGYLYGGGFGAWEFPVAIVVAFFASRGL